jgi:parallel beta-helix repeat protein
MKEIVVIALILISLMILGVVCVQPIKAQYQGDITINADGSISPSTAPIQQDDDVYILTGDLIGSRITVMRSYMTLDGDGHTIQGEASKTASLTPGQSSNYGGIFLESIHNVTVRGFSLKYCLVGISLNQSSHITISDNNITGTWGYTYYSSYERGSTDYTTFQEPAAISLWKSSSNKITGNRLEGNTFGLYLREHSEHNIIVGNIISGSANKGVVVTVSPSNTFYHNNFDNELNVYDSGQVISSQTISINAWDNGKEGNFWSDYNGPDANSDGIGGSPYRIDSNNQDRYPLMKPWEPDVAPPHISISSPENKTYDDSNVTLTFSTSEPTSKISYSLDGQDNVTVTGNTTLNEVPNGAHNLTVYATDKFGNTGASKIVYFNVEVPEPFPTIPAATASAATIAVMGAGLLVYFKKRKHQAETVGSK